MSKQVVNALRFIAPLDSYPPELVDLASSLSLQSLQKVTSLKPEEESARYYICSYLAVEKCKSTFALPEPSSKQAPVPPRVFSNLLARFRSALLSGSPAPKTPTKTRTFSRSTTVTPSKSSTKSTSRSNQKRSFSRSPSPSPSPVKRRGIAKDTDPKDHDLERICDALSLNDDSTQAISRGYRLYNNLVKERWGLLCGLVYVITNKSQPELITAFTKDTFSEKLIQLARHMNMEKLEEWINWTEMIVTDQTWIRRITVEERSLATKSTSRKHASGIGNMLNYSMMFSSIRRHEDYENWKSKILSKIERLEVSS